jgi:hypothetical protein
VNREFHSTKGSKIKPNERKSNQKKENQTKDSKKNHWIDLQGNRPE